MIERNISIDVDHLKKHDLNTLAHVLSKTASWSSLSIANARTVVQMSQQFAQLGRDADVTRAGVGDGVTSRTVSSRERPPPPSISPPATPALEQVTAGGSPATPDDLPQKARRGMWRLAADAPPPEPSSTTPGPPSPAGTVTDSVTSVTPGVTDSVTRVTPGRPS